MHCSKVNQAAPILQAEGPGACAFILSKVISQDIENEISNLYVTFCSAGAANL